MLLARGVNRNILEMSYNYLFIVTAFLIICGCIVIDADPFLTRDYSDPLLCDCYPNSSATHSSTGGNKSDCFTGLTMV